MADLDHKAIRGGDIKQAEFAHRFGLPISIIRDLKRNPAKTEATTRAYLLVISQEQEALKRALRSA